MSISPIPNLLATAAAEGWTDEAVIDRVRAGETALYEVIMRRYNQRLYRVARAILHDDSAAEDVIQDAYFRAYQNLHQFAGRSQFSTWLIRIAVNESLTRRRQTHRTGQLDLDQPDGEISMKLTSPSPSPEQNASTAQVRDLLEQAVLNLPEQFRTVIMLRDIEELSTTETAHALDLTEQNVKVRLHRGHRLMRDWFLQHVGVTAREAFPFMGHCCNRIVQAVLARIADLPTPAPITH